MSLIGVIISEEKMGWAREFFELFKTSWEVYSADRDYYDVVIIMGGGLLVTNAKVVISYIGQENDLNDYQGVKIQSENEKVVIESDVGEIPIYGHCYGLVGEGIAILRVKESSEVVGLKTENAGGKRIYFGFSLIEEICYMLCEGQPKDNAEIPTIEMHVSVLRNAIINCGIPVVEIPPMPAGYDFMVCLTHDVDFVGIRKHRLDRTMWGFLYRASVGSVVRFLKGTLAFRKMIGNWKAILRLPLIYLGIMEDFWMQFDRFLEMEKGLGGTYFFIPFKNRRGCLGIRKAAGKRACKYSIEDVRGEIEKLMGQGCEIGLHGIDAWMDKKQGRDEYERIREITGQQEIGVRMHWLYFDAESPRILDKVGFSYDSTVGYNEAIGYRAGTSQVYQHPGVENLAEIPMHVQDTALFYPERMNLSAQKAFQKIEGLIENAEKYGGVLTINWHHRSLGPERFWDDFYAELLRLLKEKRVWFGTAWQVAKWFRRRRALSVEEIQGLKFSTQMNLDGTLIQSGEESPIRALQSQGNERKGKSWNSESYGLGRARE